MKYGISWSLPFIQPQFTSLYFTSHLNAKHSVWDSKISNPLCLKLLQLFVSFHLEIPAPQCCMHYTPDGRGDFLDILVRQNVRLTEIFVTDVLNSDHLPVMFNILDPLRTRESLDPVEKLRDCELFQSLASEVGECLLCHCLATDGVPW
jgi:hypothetical protein